ncbi:MAG: DNA-binding protein [Candidatus Nanohaloarchaea archaeon]|nr:DNA-binding protein [Candidatus Nanohaloarchaea archaeon]
MVEYVLDANIFIHAAAHTVPFDDAATVPAVMDELESAEAGDRFDLSDVDVYQPDADSVERVEDVQDRLGEALSAADVQVLALALERDATVVTDDYGVQNVADALDVPYEGLEQDGIEEQIEWKRVCGSCGASVDGDRCGRCGGDSERVPAE